MRPSLSTTTGDTGRTGLFGGKRVSKASVRLHAYGTVDELNACIGLVLAEDGLRSDVRDQLLRIQSDLFTVGADLATPMEDNAAKVDRIELEHVQRLEEWGVEIEKDLPLLRHFILPNGSRAGSLLHLARTVCRRAERWSVDLAEQEKINSSVVMYLNRLSDYLFLAARAVNHHSGMQETGWEG